ncbi:MAG TPA: ATP-dependent 6-phosphofructokinase [Candidatus Sulfotelmatobacter sp.]|jgi:6-phosphofructokinase 1|nr:ATP-dependent 6-phosphofructokinase [Candidatus Sulfotelmatobacter sp.]
MSDIRCIGIATGGGDAPGLNAVIRAAAKAAILKYKWKVIGIPDGFDGLIWPEKSFALTLDRVSGILPRGGTILGTTNRGNPFNYKTQENGEEVVRDISDEILSNSKKLGIDAIITIGGDGSQKIGYELFQKGMKIVGVPKTIDNDLSATEVTFGFDTALHTVTDAIDKIHTTAASHHRVMVVEVMGRDCGWIALAGGIAGGAHIILIPEIPFTMKKICDFIAERESRGSRFTIVAVAEGIKLPPELKQMARGNPAGNTVGDAIGLFANKEVRVSVLGHIQRGGSPSPYDRVLATRFGVAAVDLIAEGQFGKMVALRSDSIVAVDIANAIGKLKTVRPDGELVRTARAIGIGFGD